MKKLYTVEYTEHTIKLMLVKQINVNYVRLYDYILYLTDEIKRLQLALL